jgi:hypothetical protein
MNMVSLTGLITGVVMLCLVAPGPGRAGLMAAESVTQQLSEANAAFTFAGEPINPRAVSDLLTSLSDTLPGPVAIDVAGTHHSNRYFGKSERKDDGSVFAESDGGGSVSYKHLGVLPGGIHVLQIAQSGGGSGIFEDLLLVKFATDFEFQDDGTKRDRLMMIRVGEISLAIDSPQRSRFEATRCASAPTRDRARRPGCCG